MTKHQQNRSVKNRIWIRPLKKSHADPTKEKSGSRSDRKENPAPILDLTFYQLRTLNCIVLNILRLLPL